MLGLATRILTGAIREGVEDMVRRLVLRLVFLGVAAVLIALALVFACTAAGLALAPLTGGWQAAAIVAGTQLLLAVIAVLIASSQKRRGRRTMRRTAAQVGLEADAAMLVLGALALGLAAGRGKG